MAEGDFEAAFVELTTIRGYNASVEHVEVYNAGQRRLHVLFRALVEEATRAKQEHDKPWPNGTQHGARLSLHRLAQSFECAAQLLIEASEDADHLAHDEAWIRLRYPNISEDNLEVVKRGRRTRAPLKFAPTDEGL